MNKEEILNHESFKYLSSLSMRDRYNAFFGKTKQAIEHGLGVTITEESFMNLNDIPDECVFISCTDPFRNFSTIAVLKPINQP